MYLDFPNKIPISCYELHSIKFGNILQSKHIDWTMFQVSKTP